MSAERASVLGKESILSVAESLGPISHDVAEALAPEIEYRLRDIIQEARKFMLAARRETLTTADINYALRLRNIEPLYGFGNTGGTSAQLGDMPRFCRLYGAPDVFYLADREIAISDLIAAPFPPLPREPGIKLHWLAVNGKQPACADNPPPRFVGPATTAAAAADPGAQPPAKRAKQADGAAVVGPTTTSAAPSAAAVPLPGGAVVVGPAEHVLSKEEAELFARIVATVRAASEPPSALTGGARAGSAGVDGASWGQLSAAAAIGGDSAEPEVSGDGGATAAAAQQALLRAVLRSVAAEPSTGALAPFLAQFIGAEVSASLGKTHALRVLVRLADALLRSPQRAVEHYVHQVMPALLTCTVHKRLCSSPLDDHWGVRDAAARVVARICARYGDKYPGLQPRVTQTLLGALRDRSRPLTTHYGAVVGLAALGAHIVHGLLLPELLAGRPLAPCAPPKPGKGARPAGGAAGGYLAELVPELSAPSTVRRQEAMRVYAAALSAAGNYIHRHRRLFELAAGGASPQAAIVEVARRAALASSQAATVEPAKVAAAATDGDAPMCEAHAAAASEHAAPRGGSAADAGSALSITERALRELLPQLGVNYAHLYEQFGEAVLPCVMCEPPPLSAVHSRPSPSTPPRLAGGKTKASVPAANGSLPAPRSESLPRPNVPSRARSRMPGSTTMSLSLLAIC